MSDRRLSLTLAFMGTGNLSAMMRRMVGEGGAAAASLRGLTNANREQQRELRELEQRMSRAGVPTREMIERQRELERQIERTTTDIERQRRAIDRQGRADAMGSAARSSGSQNIATGATMAAGLFAVGKISADFQDGMTDIQQKADLSAKATALMQQNIIKAARAAKQLPETMRAGVDVLSGFGMDPQAATKMIAPIGLAATAYRAEVSDLSAASYANFSNLKVPVEQTSAAINAMAMAGKKGAFEMKDMAQYFPSLTAQAQAFGQTGVGAVSDLAAALQIARKATGDSASAATNVENLMAKINTEETIKKFKEFGINLPAELKKAYAAGKTPLEAIAELSNKAVGGKLDKLSFLFGDMQAQSALRPLIQNMEEYRQIRADALKASQAAPGQGVVDADFALRAQNASVQARALTGNLITVAMVMGERLLPSFVAISARLVEVTNRFSSWAEKHPGAVDLIVKMVVALAAFNLGLGAARIAFGATIGPLMQLYNGFRFLRESQTVIGFMARAGPMLSTAFGVMRTAALFLARGLMQAGLMMMANPIILIITAIVAVVALAAYLIYKNWNTIGPMLAKAWQSVMSFFAGAGAWLQGAFTGLCNTVMAGVRLAWKAFLMFTPAGWLIQLAPQMLKVGGQIMQGLIDGIGGKVEAIKTLVLGIAGKVAGWFRGVLGIKSPSRVFMGFGDNISEGLSIGIRRTMQNPMRAARTMAAGVAGAMALSGSALAAEPLPAIKTIAQLTPRPPAHPAGGQGTAPIHIGTLNINISGAGQSAEDIAAEVKRQLSDVANTVNARARSEFRDDED